MRAIPRLLTLIVALAMLLLLALLHSAFSSESVTLSSNVTRGASVWVIRVDLNDPNVKVDIGLPAKGIAHSESFAAFIKRHAPLAAVTGTYFDTRTLRPTGTIVVGGKTVHESHVGTAVCFTSDNKVSFVAAKPGRACDLSKAESGLRTGPRLLAGGQYALSPRSEGFRCTGLFGARMRMALGVTARNELLLVLVRTPVTFSRLASIMHTLGAVDAVCLDGGASSAMYFKGRLIRRPGRLLTNVVEVLRRNPTPAVGAGRGESVIVVAVTRPSYSGAVLCAGSARSAPPDAVWEQAAVLGDPIRLRFPKGFHALIPVDWA